MRRRKTDLSDLRSRLQGWLDWWFVDIPIPRFTLYGSMLGLAVVIVVGWLS